MRDQSHGLIPVVLLMLASAVGPTQSASLPAPDPGWYRAGSITFVAADTEHTLALPDFGDWRAHGEPASLTGVGKGPARGLTMEIELSRPRADQLAVVARVLGERDDLRVRRLELPPPFALDREPTSYLAVPLHQGCLIPGDWDKAIEAEYQCQSGMLCMNWWGQRTGKLVGVTTVDTFWDYSLRLRNHPPLAPQVSLIWESRSGRFSYPRRLTITFLRPDAGYVEMARQYRAWSRQHGLFVPLTTKLKTLPAVQRLIDSTVAPLSVCHHDMRPGSPNGSSLVPFETLSRQLQAMHDAGLTNAYIHLDGWGKRGYDALEPAHLPPCPEAGGWGGLVALSQKAQDFGYLFGLHDNYWALYRDSPAWDEKLTQKFEDQTYPLGAWWYGGEQSLLCPTFALRFEQANVREMVAHGVKLSAYYLDVFSADRLQECLDPAHPVTRQQCAQLRGDCLRWLRQQGWVVSSECGADWSIPVIDAAYSITHPGVGITVPLFGLVYHDALLVHGNGDRLDMALWGQQPLTGYTTSKRMIAAIGVSSKLFRALATRQMLWHRFLSPDAGAPSPPGAPSGHDLEEAGYAGGISVAIDRAHERWRVRGVSGFTGDWEALPPTSYVIRCRVADFRQTGPRTAQISFEWQTEVSPDEGGLSCFCHLTHPDSPQGEEIVGGCDHALPQDGQWAPGSVVRDGPYTITMPGGYQGAFELRIGLLSKLTGGRGRVAGLAEYDAGGRGLLGRVALSGSAADAGLAWDAAVPGRWPSQQR
jgi:hypothetical protein